MMRIAITVDAHETLATTLPVGTVAYKRSLTRRVSA